MPVAPPFEKLKPPWLVEAGSDTLVSAAPLDKLPVCPFGKEVPVEEPHTAGGSDFFSSPPFGDDAAEGPFVLIAAGDEKGNDNP